MKQVGLLLALIAGLFLFGDRGARTQFAQNNYVGTSSGSPNGHVITVPNIATMSDLLSQPISFKAGIGLSNTGPTAINVAGIATVVVNRAVPGGVTTLGGGEIVAGQVATVIWSGTEFLLQNPVNTDPPGKIMDYAGTSCPAGYLAASGQTTSDSTFPALFAVVGSTWGATGPGFYTLPDLRNRTTYGQDINVGGFSGRITSAGGNFNGQTVGAAGASQNIALGVNQIPVITTGGTINAFTPVVNITPFTPAGSVGISDTRTWGTAPVLAPGIGFSPNAGAGFQSTTVAVSVTGGSITGSFTGNSVTPTATANSITPTFNGAVFNSGGGQSHPTLSPGAITSKCVRT